MMPPGPSIPTAIRAHLEALGIPYRYLTHAPTLTSEDSARARGEPLEIGAKALVLKLDDRFITIVLSAARKLDSPAVKKRFGSKSCRFASKEELLELTGLVPGSVPPFGPPILPLELHLDAGITTLPRVAFNCGSLTESIVMATPDYLRAAGPATTGPFAQPG